MRLGRFVRFGAALVLSLVAASAAEAQYAGDLRQPPYAYTDPLPIFGKRLAARGVAFPLPWGIGLNYMFMQQPIAISNIALGAGDGEPVDVSNFVKFKSVESKVHVINLRADLWLLPFLNVYALLNYSPKSQTSIVLSEPFALNAGAEQWIVGEGFGGTAAFGVLGAWATFDVNWTWNHAQLVDEPVRTTMLAPRVGMNVGKWGKVGLNLWLGGMAQIIGAQTNGSIRLSDAIGQPSGKFQDELSAWYGMLSPVEKRAVEKLVDRLGAADAGETTVSYELDKKVSQRWNMLVGAQLELNERWFVRAEAGFIKRESFLLGLNYRFNTPGFRQGSPH